LQIPVNYCTYPGRGITYSQQWDFWQVPRTSNLGVLTYMRIAN